MRYLIQLLVPQFDNLGQPFEQELFARTRAELIARFGGLTAYVRSPARGIWKADDGSVARDDIIILEVMADTLDRGWWTGHRRMLEDRFRQDELVVRAIQVEGL